MFSKNINSSEYSSRIEEFIPKHMIIAMPMEKGYPVFIESGRGFYGKVFDDSGVYLFKSTFVHKKMNPIPIWVVTMPYDIKKIQQRAFVRLDVAQPLVLEYSVENKEDQQDEVLSFNSLTRDISGGGIQAVCEKPIEIGKKVKMVITLNEYGDVEVDGVVTRVNKPQVDRQVFWISIKFVGVQESIRDKISRFIFRKQLEQRQKGF